MQRHFRSWNANGFNLSDHISGKFDMFDKAYPILLEWGYITMFSLKKI